MHTCMHDVWNKDMSVVLWFVAFAVFFLHIWWLAPNVSIMLRLKRTKKSCTQNCDLDKLIAILMTFNGRSSSVASLMIQFHFTLS